MKKILNTLILGMLLLPTVTRAQNPVRISTDTLPCGMRQPNYYYTYWYDTACWYLQPETYGVWNSNGVYLFTTNGAENHNTPTIQQYVSHPIRMRGLWAMVSQYPGGDPATPLFFPIRDSTRLPEYLYLYERKAGYETCYEDSMFLTRIATVRWDTAQPKMLCLPKTADNRYENMYCHVYEALFDTVYTIEGEFWIGASANSNTLHTSVENFGHDHFPALYVCMGTGGWNYLPYNTYSHRCSGHGADGPWYHYMTHDYYGPYGVITDGQRYVEVASADSAQGIGQTSTFYPDSTCQTITALPNRGYRFSHWNDGVTDNPRTIFVTQDTVFTAYFAPLQAYSVGVRSNDDTLGYVEMGTYRVPQAGDVIHDGEEPYYVYTTRSDSIYYEGETARFRATALEGAHFAGWDDGETENPRSVVVTGDLLFTALFAEDEPVGTAAPAKGCEFSLVPNPAKGKVRCVVGEGFGGGTLRMQDAAGREVLRRELSRGTRTCVLKVADLPAGTYFVTLTTTEGTSTQRLVIK